MSLLVGCSNEMINENPGESDNPIIDVPNEKIVTLSLNGDKVTFPILYRELEQMGWIVNTDINQQIEPNTFVPNFFLRKNDGIIRVSFYNPTNQTLDMKDAYISEIAAENRTFGPDKAIDIKVMETISWENSIDEISATLGEYKESQDALFKNYAFEINNRENITISFYLDGRDGNQSRWIQVISYKSP